MSDDKDQLVNANPLFSTVEEDENVFKSKKNYLKTN